MVYTISPADEPSEPVVSDVYGVGRGVFMTELSGAFWEIRCCWCRLSCAPALMFETLD